MSTFVFTNRCSVAELRYFSAELARRPHYEATEENVFALLAETAELFRDISCLDADMLVTADDFLPKTQRRELLRALCDDSVKTLCDVAAQLSAF